MNRLSILVVEDEPDIRDLIGYLLEKEGYKVTTAADGAVALQKLANDEFDLLLLDLMLPEVDGLEVCRKVKADRKTAELPIIMLTAKGEESDVITGFNLGADDYIIKPFSPRVLCARIKAVLRRRSSGAQHTSGDTVSRGDLEIRRGHREVRVKGEQVQLTFTEFQILDLLAGRPGWVFTRYQIVDAVRGEDYPVTERAIDVHIVGLRKKLGECSNYVETVRGVGYRFKEDV